jgi:hypothetical protein
VEKKYYRSTKGGRGNGSDVTQLHLLAKLINEAYHKLKAEKVSNAICLLFSAVS